eukprot:758178-Hanusia_phi.AAC.1
MSADQLLLHRLQLRRQPFSLPVLVVRVQQDRGKLSSHLFSFASASSLRLISASAFSLSCHINVSGCHTTSPVPSLRVACSLPAPARLSAAEASPSP